MAASQDFRTQAAAPFPTDSLNASGLPHQDHLRGWMESGESCGKLGACAVPSSGCVMRGASPTVMRMDGEDRMGYQLYLALSKSYLWPVAGSTLPRNGLSELRCAGWTGGAHVSTAQLS